MVIRNWENEVQTSHGDIQRFFLLSKISHEFFSAEIFYLEKVRVSLWDKKVFSKTEVRFIELKIYIKNSSSKFLEILKSSYIFA